MAKVRDAIPDPEFSDFTRKCTEVGKKFEDDGYELFNWGYSQGEQTFEFRKDGYDIFVAINETTGEDEE